MRTSYEILPFASLNGVELDIASLPDKSITVEEYQHIRANSPGFKALIPKLNDDALKAMVENNIKNCGRYSDIVYEGVLIQHLVPELLNRL